MLGVQLLGSVNPNMFTPSTPGPLGVIVFGVQMLGSVHHIMCSPWAFRKFGVQFWTLGGFGRSWNVDVLGFGLLGVWTFGPFFGRFGFWDGQGLELEVEDPFWKLGAKLRTLGDGHWGPSF